MKNDRPTRRAFLAGAMATAAGCATSSKRAPGVLSSKSPTEKLNIAAIGTGNRAAADIAGCASQNIVALADSDSNFLDAASGKYKGARRYTDFRVLLETEGDKLDAVIGLTPRQYHYLTKIDASAKALLCKHCFINKEDFND